jgi:hypothetical protein
MFCYAVENQNQRLRLFLQFVSLDPRGRTGLLAAPDPIYGRLTAAGSQAPILGNIHRPDRTRKNSRHFRSSFLDVKDQP